MRLFDPAVFDPSVFDTAERTVYDGPDWPRGARARPALVDVAASEAGPTIVARLALSPISASEA
jgi:hypothetical protein